MKNIYLLICVLCTFGLKSQTVFWAETFGTGSTCSNNQATLANGFATSNGTWNVTTIGTNDPYANAWYISQTEGGTTPGSCGVSCLTNPLITNKTLHIANVPGSPNSALCPTGDCGANYDPGIGNNQVRTNVRAESPKIICTGKTGVILQFDYILRGNKGDSMNVWYSDGSIWTQLAPVPAPTPTCVTTAPDTTGMWATATYPLPATANNNAQVKIAFQWINNDDGKGGNPSVAIDNIALLATSTGGGPSSIDTVAVFSPDTSNHNFIYCTNVPYHFTGFATQGTILAYQWEVYPSTNVLLNPSHPSLTQNGVDITFPSPGIYSITVIASSQNHGVDSSSNFPTLKFNTTTLTVNQTPTVTVSPLIPVVCQGGTGTNLYATGAGVSGTYTWTAPTWASVPTVFASDPNQDSVNVNPSGIPHTAITYSVVGTTTLGCNSKLVAVTVTVTPPPVPKYTANPDTICAGSYSQLVVSNVPVTTTVHWGAAFSAGLGSNSGISVSSTPNYHGIIDTVFTDTAIVHVPGCPDYGPKLISLHVRPLPIVHVVSDTVDNCNKMGAVLAATSVPSASLGVTYNWTPHKNLSDTIGSPVTATPTLQTTYYVTPVLNGCVGLKDSVMVFVGDTTSASINSEFQIICSGQKDHLYGFPQNGPTNHSYHYVWLPSPFISSSVSGDTMLVQPPISTIYTLTVYGTCVKHNIATLGVTVNTCIKPNVNFTKSSDTICVNHCITYKDLTQNNSTKPLFYSWIFTGGSIAPVAGSTVSGDTLFYSMTNNTPLNPVKVCYHINSSLNNHGAYPVVEIVQTGIGQVGVKVDSVYVLPGPQAHAGGDQTISQGSTINLNASSSQGYSAIQSYNWFESDSSNLSCNSGPGCVSPTVKPAATTHYTLTVIDRNGCTSTDTITVFVDIICRQPYVANAFSPNGDGLNDVLHVKSNCDISSFSFKIFDRWGEKVFESADPAFG